MERARNSWMWIAVLVLPTIAFAYPPAVGIVGKSPNCLSCHVSNGPWEDEARTIVDIVDAATGKSLRQADGRFLLEVERGRTRMVITQIGRQAGDEVPPPVRNAWLYLDPTQLETGSLSKFAPGWSVNLPMACRIVGDETPNYPGAAMTALPMTVRPGDSARSADLELQVMLTSGESAKGNPNSWLKSNYVVKNVMLRVVDP